MTLQSVRVEWGCSGLQKFGLAFFQHASAQMCHGCHDPQRDGVHVFKLHTIIMATTISTSKFVCAGLLYRFIRAVFMVALANDYGGTHFVATRIHNEHSHDELVIGYDFWLPDETALRPGFMVSNPIIASNCRA
jgi:hypothetical protein